MQLQYRDTQIHLQPPPPEPLSALISQVHKPPTSPRFPLVHRGASPFEGAGWTRMTGRSCWSQRLVAVGLAARLAGRGCGHWGHHFAEISKEIVPIDPQMGACRAKRSLRYLGFISAQGAVVRSGGPWISHHFSAALRAVPSINC